MMFHKINVVNYYHYKTIFVMHNILTINFIWNHHGFCLWTFQMVCKEKNIQNSTCLTLEYTYLESEALLATSGLQLRCLITVDSSKLRLFFRIPCFRLLVAGSTTLGENVTGGVWVECASVFSSESIKCDKINHRDHFFFPRDDSIVSKRRNNVLPTLGNFPFQYRYGEGVRSSRNLVDLNYGSLFFLSRTSF